jgi:hypothetical protein
MNDVLHKAGNEGEANYAFGLPDVAPGTKAKFAGEPLWRTSGVLRPRRLCQRTRLLSRHELFMPTAAWRISASMPASQGRSDLRADIRRPGIARCAETHRGRA